MKTFATIAAATLALGWGVAKAETVDTVPADDSAAAVGVGAGTDTGATTPVNPATVQPPPPPPVQNSDTSVNSVTSPSYPDARPSDAPAAATTGAAAETAAPPIGPLPNEQPVQVQPVQPVEHDVYTERPWIYKVGAGFLLGGGFEDIRNPTLRSMTGDGGFWNARVVAGTRQYLGIEAAYQGSARGITALGAQNDSRLISNGVEGDLRLNIPIVMGRGLLEPFGFVGVGWQHWNVTNANVATADLSGTRDDVLTVPYGGGLEFGYGALLADARFTYRQTYFNNLVPGGNLTWTAGGQLGVQF
jgi:hypothetical protein